MDPRTLQLIQRGLVAAVTVVLALLVITAFMKVLETSEPSATPQTTTTTGATTTTAEPTTTSTLPAGVTTTTTDVVTPAICAEPEPPGDGATVLRVFYPCGGTGLATGGTYVYRAVPPTDLVLTTTMREMVRGLDPEEEALGFKSPFPEGSEGSFLGASIEKETSTAFVEFTANVFSEGADTPEGSQILLSTLNANVFKFDTIKAVEYRLGGSCDAFWQQLGGSCEVVTRAQWQAQLAAG